MNQEQTIDAHMKGTNTKETCKKKNTRATDYCKTTDQYRDMKDAHAWSSCVPSNSSHHLTEESGNCLASKTQKTQSSKKYSSNADTPCNISITKEIST
jgi:hypothetical protein